MKKRAKYIQDIVNRANFILKQSHVTYPYKSDLFNMVTQLLLDNKCYEGYNWFIEKTVIEQSNIRTFNDYAAAYKKDGQKIEDVDGCFVQIY